MASNGSCCASLAACFVVTSHDWRLRSPLAATGRQAYDRRHTLILIVNRQLECP